MKAAPPRPARSGCHVARARPVLLALALCTVLAPGAPAIGAPPDGEWSATYTGRTEAGRIVISRQDEWATLWASVFSGTPAPAVDFERAVVACVFLGERPSGGYGVAFGQPFVRAAEFVVPFSEVKPSGIATMALTRPCALKVFEPPPGLRVVIEETLTPVLPAVALTRIGAAATEAGAAGSPAERKTVELPGVARFEVPAGWTVEKSRGTVDPSVRCSDDPDIIRVRLLGGEGSRCATMADFLTGFQATTIGRPPEKLKMIRVAGAEVWLYRHGYPINLGDPHVASPGEPQLADEKFCLIPLGTRFIVLSWAREELPDFTGRADEIWESFLNSFALIR